MCRFDHAFFFRRSPEIRCQNPTVCNPAIGWDRPDMILARQLPLAPATRTPP